jgi:hypothetical protein
LNFLGKLPRIAHFFEEPHFPQTAMGEGRNPFISLRDACRFNEKFYSTTKPSVQTMCGMGTRWVAGEGMLCTISAWAFSDRRVRDKHFLASVSNCDPAIRHLSESRAAGSADELIRGGDYA